MRGYSIVKIGRKVYREIAAPATRRAERGSPEQRVKEAEWEGAQTPRRPAHRGPLPPPRYFPPQRRPAARTELLRKSRDDAVARPTEPPADRPHTSRWIERPCRQVAPDATTGG